MNTAMPNGEEAFLALINQHQGGHAYVERMFRGDRANLSDCLGQLNGQER